MRRLGGRGCEEANKIFDAMQRYEMFKNDAYRDVLGADHAMRLDRSDDVEAHAQSAVAKEPGLFIARNALHLVQAKKADFAGIARSLRELAEHAAAFAAKYARSTAQLAAFRDSAEGKALLAELQ